jgi:hypothetical protein
MGRTGIEPVTLGLKVLQIKLHSEREKRRFSASGKPFLGEALNARSHWCVGGVSTRRS